MIILNDLMNIMEEINDIYLKLYRLELLGELNSNYFFELVGNLKVMLIKEEELFNKFADTSEYDYLKEYIVDEKGPIFTRIKDYITLYENKNIKMDDSHDTTLAINLVKLYDATTRNIFLVYLSFFQEYIETTNSVEMKERMLNLKYYNAFTKLCIGQLLIENDFRIDREVYANYLVLDTIKMDDIDNYDIILDGYLTVVMEMLKQLFSIKDKQYNDYNVMAASRGVEFMIKACFSLLTDSDYELKKDDIFQTINELSDSYNSISGEIMDSIIESRIVDRNRVRKISLRPLDD